MDKQGFWHLGKPLTRKGGGGRDGGRKEGGKER